MGAWVPGQGVVDTLIRFERRKSSIARGQGGDRGAADDAETEPDPRACGGDRRCRRRAAAARGVVCPREAGPALAAVPGSVPCLGERDHAPADAGGASEGVLRPVHGPVSHGARPRRRQRAGGAQALGGARLLPPRAAAPCRGAACGRGARGGVPADRRRTDGAARHRPLHRRCGRLDRDGRAGADRRGQLAPRARAAGRPRSPGRRCGGRADLGDRCGPRAAHRSRHLQPGPHGPRCDGLHARPAAVRGARSRRGARRGGRAASPASRCCPRPARRSGSARRRSSCGTATGSSSSGAGRGNGGRASGIFPARTAGRRWGRRSGACPTA